MLLYAGKYRTEDKSKTDIIKTKYYPENSKQHKTQQNKTSLVQSPFTTLEVGLFYNAHEPRWGFLSVWDWCSWCVICIEVTELTGLLIYWYSTNDKFTTISWWRVTHSRHTFLKWVNMSGLFSHISIIRQIAVSNTPATCIHISKLIQHGAS